MTDTELLDWCEKQKLFPHAGECWLTDPTTFESRKIIRWYITSDMNRVTWGSGGPTVREAIESAIMEGPRS